MKVDLPSSSKELCLEPFRTFNNGVGQSHSTHLNKLHRKYSSLHQNKNLFSYTMALFYIIFSLIIISPFILRGSEAKVLELSDR